MSDFGLAREGRGKASKKPLLTRSLVDPAVVVSRKPRPKVVAAPPIATSLLIEVPRHVEGRWGGGARQLDRRLACFFIQVPEYLYGDRTLHPPFARPSSTMVSSASLRAYPGAHPLILGVPSDGG
jgi:hypothetical protein